MVQSASDDIDLLAYGRTIWRSRYFVLATGLIAALAACAVNRRTPPTYEVEFRLIASEPLAAEEAPVPQGERARSLAREIIGHRMVGYRELAESPTVAAALIAELGLAAPPYDLTPQRFLQEHVTVNLIRDSTIVSVSVRLDDPDLLVRVAGRYAEHVVAAAQRLSAEEAEYMSGRLREEVDAAHERVMAADRALQDYRSRTHVELLRKDVETMLRNRPGGPGSAAAGKLDRLYEAETQLEALQRAHQVARDAYLSAAARHEEARLLSTIRSSRLQILDAPLPPDGPLAPRTLRNTAAATLIALTIAVAGVLLFEPVRRRRGR